MWHIQIKRVKLKTIGDAYASAPNNTLNTYKYFWYLLVVLILVSIQVLCIYGQIRHIPEFYFSEA